MILKSPTLRCFLILLLFLTGAEAYAQNPVGDDQDAFKQGIEAFKQGMYQQALERFLHAEAQLLIRGQQDDKLLYNLGATYYKLKQYRKARGYFVSILETPKYNDLAHYNLALIDYRLEDYQQSLQHLEAIQHSRNTNLRLLAKALLAKVRRHSRPKQDIAFRAYSGKISYTGGHDSNVSLVEDLAPVQRLSDFQHTLKLQGRYLLHGDWKQGLNAYIRYFDQRHRRENDYDYAIARVGLDYHKDLTSFYSRYRLNLARSRFANSPYQQLSELQALYVIPYDSAQSLSLSLHALDVSSLNSVYDHLEGQRYRGRVSWRTSNISWRHTLAYTYESNRRRDYEVISTTGERDFRSQSPVRHELRYSISNIGDKLSWYNHIYYRLSLYPDANTNVSPNIKREDRRLRLLSLLNLELDDGWAAIAQYQYTDNQSNIDQYGYDGHNIALGLELKF